MRTVARVRGQRNPWVLCAAVVGVVATVAAVGSADVPLAVRSPALQGVIETAGAMATLAAALTVHGRFRNDRSLSNGALLAGLLVFGIANLVAGVLPGLLSGLPPSLGTWGGLGARFAATLLFAAAPFLPRARSLRTAVPALGAVAIVAIVLGGCWLLDARLPPAVDLDGPIRTVADLRAHPAVVTLNITALVALLAGAWGYARRDDPLDRALAGAGVLAAFSRLHLALVPSLYSGAVYSGDVLRLGFHAMVLAAVVAEIRRYWNDQRALAVAEERRRVARDLHDGIAQELAFIATTAGRLSQHRGHGDAEMVASAARRALEESRRAIATLTRPLDEALPDALEETLYELARRTGGEVRLDLDRDVVVGVQQREEILRIAREAVGNALRHGAASLVEVRLHAGERLSLTVRDDGTGFDPDAPPNPHGFGLISMRERAAAMGAELDIRSIPGEGTQVVLRL